MSRRILRAQLALVASGLITAGLPSWLISGTHRIVVDAKRERVLDVEVLVGSPTELDADERGLDAALELLVLHVALLDVDRLDLVAVFRHVEDELHLAVGG